MSTSGYSYDRDFLARRNASRVAYWFAAFVVGSFAFAYTWNLYVGPYTSFYEDRASEQRKARTYLTTTTCTDPHKRSALEGYNQCERSERIVTQRLAVMAFFDLMDYLRVCDKGVCTVGGINITSSAWFLFQLLMAAAAILYIVSFFGLASSMWGRHTAAYQMPMTMAGVHDIALYQRMAMAQKHAADEAMRHSGADVAYSSQQHQHRPAQPAFTQATVYDSTVHCGKNE